MSIIHDGLRLAKKRGFRALGISALRLAREKWFRLSPRYQTRFIFDAKWDLCIILDACRHDAICEVANNFDFLPTDPEKMFSIASNSEEWLVRTQNHPVLDTERVGYVTANPYTDQVDVSAFAEVIECWRSGWNDDIGTVPARPVTDAAIQVGRSESFDRLLVHYMQPHFPSVPSPLGSEMPYSEFGEHWEGNVWEQLRNGKVDENNVWNSYLDNLQYVLNDIRILLNNIDAPRVLLTADHANCFGEKGKYGHMFSNPVPAVRCVPWIQISATDEGTHTPNKQNEVDASISVDDRLESLGYI